MQADTILRTYVVVLVVRRHAVDLKDGVLENRRETTELQAVNSAEIEILVSDANIDLVSSDDLGAFHQDGSEAVLAGNRNMLRCEGESYGRTGRTDRQVGEFLADGSTQRRESGE